MIAIVSNERSIIRKMTQLVDRASGLSASRFDMDALYKMGL